MPTANDPRPADDHRRAHENAVLAALDFEPRVPDAPRKRRPFRFALFIALHVAVSVIFAEMLAGGRTGTPLALAALAWAGCVVVIVRAVFRSGVLRSFRPASGWRRLAA